MGIVILPKEVVEKIAAGEVVERPASVVKELCENSADAGARSISVEIDGGGIERIRVGDDGCGMGPEDLLLSLERHATSKITSADDLWGISTMGFRGEALASIGAVSRLAIESRPGGPAAEEGARVEMSSGSIEGPVPAGCAPGTVVTVFDLFHNVPARRKFIRSARAESGHAVDAVMEMALAFPAIRFDVSVDGARRLSLPACAADVGDEGARARVEAVLGEDSSVRLLRVAEQVPGLAVAGFVAERGRSRGRDVHLFVNRRPVRDRLLMHALTEGFGERLSRGASPAAVLWVEIDPARVDVNVHPAKREVKFAEPGAVHSFISSALKKTLGSAVQSVFSPSGSAVRGGCPSPCAPGVESAVMRHEHSRPSAGPAVSGEAQRSFGEFGARMRPLGQFAASYIACEGEGGELVIIDQHAAHERLGFDALVAQHAAGPVARQRLLIPEQVDLSEAEAAEIQERSELLSAAGFEIEPFGGGTVLVKAAPALLGGASTAPLVRMIAAELSELGEHVSMEEALRKVFALAACHRQVRAGDSLSPEEVASLVRDMERGDVKTCPHGRPALVRIEKGEIEKWFGRK
ncbi:MAG: DNA mismatch repair endonuclease MutL [Proteobacteria bacterium]|nr:DNA mismatch repair endonuclease MutL [Pseudomonadota bacterium]